MDEIFLKIPAAPPTANLIWRQAGGRSYLSPKAAAYYELAGLTLHGVKIPPDWKYVEVNIVVQLRRQAGDVDNRIKPVLDALTRVGVWKDDRIVARVSCEYMEPDGGDGATFVRIARRKERFAPWSQQEWKESIR